MRISVPVQDKRVHSFEWMVEVFNTWQEYSDRCASCRVVAVGKGYQKRRRDFEAMIWVWDEPVRSRKKGCQMNNFRELNLQTLFERNRRIRSGSLSFGETEEVLFTV